MPTQCPGFLPGDKKCVSLGGEEMEWYPGMGRNHIFVEDREGAIISILCICKSEKIAAFIKFLYQIKWVSMLETSFSKFLFQIFHLSKILYRGQILTSVGCKLIFTNFDQ